MSTVTPARVANALRGWVGLASAAAQEADIAAFQRFFDHNRISRMSPLRERKPVCPIGKSILLTRRADVLAVLEQDDNFMPVYAEKLPGTFVLGADHAQHVEQRRTLDDALEVATLRDKIDRDVGRSAREIVERGRFAGQLDVGADLVHPILAQVLENFLGLPQPESGNLWFWARDIFEHIFLNLDDLPAIHERAVVANAQLREHVRAVVASASMADDTVITRLLKAKDTDEGAWLAEQDALVFTVIGLAIGWLWHGARAALIAVDELLDRPAAMTLAREAAVNGDHEALGRVLWEVLRFRPVQPFLVRKARKTTIIAPGTERETVVRAGTAVLAGTHSAMWDEADIPCPARFDDTRADDQYVIFGRGKHRCQGEEINRIQLPAMLAPLLATGDVRRGRRGGRLRWDGPRPDDLRVVFGHG